MQFAVRAAVGTAIALVLTLAMPGAQATPELGKGKKCDTCHTGTPPSKDNAKKK